MAAKRAQKARDAEEGVGPHLERIEESVVDPAIDHVDPLRSSGCAHVDAALVDKQIRPLDQFDAHLVGQIGVLEVGAVEMAWCQQHDIGRGFVAERH